MGGGASSQGSGCSEKTPVTPTSVGKSGATGSDLGSPSKASSTSGTPRLRVKGVVAPRNDAEPVKLDFAQVLAFRDLPQGDNIIAEYVWIGAEYTDGKAFGIGWKSFTLESAPISLEDLPVTSYSSVEETDVLLVPRRIYKDPFRRGDNIIVLAETFGEPAPGSGDAHGPPTDFNKRAACELVMQKAADEEPWFGIEQEYYLLDVKTDWPLGWPEGSFPGDHDGYYCSIGAAKAVGREIVDAHYKACLYAGVKIGGINSEDAPGQWEFQVGPCSGTSAADDLWMARYILQRVCETFHIGVTFDPKPVPGWAGIGCHTNFSTKGTRAPGGMKVIEEQIELLRNRHFDHIARYGMGNRRRLSGQDSTQHISAFSSGIGDRGASIRIGSRVASRGCGYYEDRRPASNMDPYEVTRLLVETTLLGAMPRLVSVRTTEDIKIKSLDQDDPLPGQVVE